MNIQKYRDVNLKELLERAGYELKQHDHHGQYKVVGLGGLIIQPETGLFNHFSAGVGGKGAIDLVMHLENCDFKKAIEYIDNCMGENWIPHTYSYQDIKKEPKNPFILPPQNENNEKVITYLTSERKLKPELVHSLIESDLLYESEKYHNCVFVCRDFSGKATGAVLRGTYNPKSGEPFKGLAPNTDGLYGMNISKYTDCQSKQLYVFEAPIDTLSYIQLHGQKEDATYLAMTGLKPNMVINYAKHIKGLEKIVLCTDNDIAGTDFDKKITSEINKMFPKLKITTEKPKAKDWNEDLCRQNERQQETEKIQITKSVGKGLER